MNKLISFAGLPGVGKTTIARRLAREVGAVYLRVDEIEAAIWRHDPGRDLGPEGYHIAAALAVSNLELGLDAIIDCVNPWAITREIFSNAATRAKASIFRVEILCSDMKIHRRRVEARVADIDGLPLPNWEKVVSRDYVPWRNADFRIDTARLAPKDTVRRIQAAMKTVPYPTG